MLYPCHGKAYVSKNLCKSVPSYITHFAVVFKVLVFLHLNSSFVCAKGRIIVCGRGEEVKWRGMRRYLDLQPPSMIELNGGGRWAAWTDHTPLQQTAGWVWRRLCVADTISKPPTYSCHRYTRDRLWYEKTWGRGHYRVELAFFMWTQERGLKQRWGKINKSGCLFCHRWPHT